MSADKATKPPVSKVQTAIDKRESARKKSTAKKS